MRIIAIVNQKGGCGKTTTAINLAACLAERGKRTLLMDLDPQAHTTVGLNIRPEELPTTLYDCLAQAFEGGQPLEWVMKSVSENLDLIPGHMNLSTLAERLAGTPGREDRLDYLIQGIENPFDFIIIDSPPTMGLLTFMTLKACHQVIIPVETSFFSLHGVGKLIETIGIYHKRLGHPIKIRVLVTAYDRRTRFAVEVLEEIRSHFPSETYQTVIRTNVKLREAASHGLPITRYNRRCNGFLDYLAVSDEVLSETAESRLIIPAISVEAHPEAHPKVEFSYFNPEASHVQLVGDFNSWQPGEGWNMIRDASGEWMISADLKPGRYRYKFVVDGQWIQDPNRTRDNGNEPHDSMIEVN